MTNLRSARPHALPCPPRPHIYLRALSSRALCSACCAPLQLTGNCTELQLVTRLLLLQGFCCALGFALRWALEGIYK